jgi:hypothetical protein
MLSRRPGVLDAPCKLSHQVCLSIYVQGRLYIPVIFTPLRKTASWGSSGLEIWRYLPGPWRVLPTRPYAEAACWPEAGQSPWPSDIKGDFNFSLTVVGILEGMTGRDSQETRERA